MITCGYCGCRGCLGEFAYVAQAGGTGPATLRRCPSCGELVIVEGVEARHPPPSPTVLRAAAARSGTRSEKNGKEV
ncbi:MAG: hypothetical protein QME88_03335 [Actinomycetota bacterium]|nr:hypothetical protein [Actinomycetota bacterium]